MSDSHFFQGLEHIHVIDPVVGLLYVKKDDVQWFCFWAHGLGILDYAHDCCGSQCAAFQFSKSQLCGGKLIVVLEKDAESVCQNDCVQFLDGVKQRYWPVILRFVWVLLFCRVAVPMPCSILLGFCLSPELS